MFYYTLNFTLSFFILGAMYVAITVFFQEQMQKLIDMTRYRQDFLAEAINATDVILSYLYLALVFCSILVSLTRPVEHGIWLFKFLMFVFGMLMTITLSGILFYLSETGFYPET